MFKSLLRSIYYTLCGLGILPIYDFNIVRRYFRFLSDREHYKSLLAPSSEYLLDGSVSNLSPAIPRLNDKNAPAGTFGDEYFFQDIWVAKQILLKSPSVHFDVGSSINGFVAHLLAASQRVVIGDIRQLPYGVDENLHSIFFDLQDSSLSEIRSYKSVSCLHTLEHVGLGRYGDKIDPFGSIKALKLIAKSTSSGGDVYISLPTASTSKVNFNSERLFSPQYILNMFHESGLSIIKGFIYYPGQDRQSFSSADEFIDLTSGHIVYALSVFKLKKTCNV